MADNSSVCTICDERHLYRQSTDWCVECEQALCSECKEFHAISKSSRNHATIPITDYQTLSPPISPVSGYCSEHEEKYRMFCQTHDKLLCPQCLEEHSECKDVIPLSKIIKNVKTSEAFRETEQYMIDIDKNLLNIEDKIKVKIRILNDQKETILSEISKVRQNINEHIDQIEAVIRKDVSDVEHKVRKDLNNVLTVLKEKKEKHSSSKQQLENVIKHASGLQTFFALRQISPELTVRETFLQSIIDNGHLDKIALELSVNKNLRSIRDKVKTFGSVHVDKSPCDLTLVKQKDKQAQLVGIQSTSIQDIKLKLTQTITTNIRETFGCDILPDGKLVFCDFLGKRLVVTDNDGKKLFQVPVQYPACDVTCISNKTVAVTILSGIYIIDISSRKILSIAKDDFCYGITSVNGSLVYCVAKRGIEMMDANCENTKTIVRCKLPNFSYIASYNDKLYYTNRDTYTVTCCDMKGKTIWTFKDETVLPYPISISVDNDGHVYVVSNGCNSVVVLSADGQQSRQILSLKDGSNNPRAIHYDRNRKQLLVINNNDVALLFRVTLTHLTQRVSVSYSHHFASVVIVVVVVFVVVGYKLLTF